MTLLGVQTTEECMLKHIVQRGILGFMAEERVVSSSSSVTSDGELFEEDLAKYALLIRSYQDEPLAGKDIPRKTKTNSMQMALSRNPAGQIQNSRGCGFLVSALPILYCSVRVLSDEIGAVTLCM